MRRASTPDICALQREGFRAIGFANPLRDLVDDYVDLAEFLRTLDRPDRARRPLLRRQRHFDSPRSATTRSRHSSFSNGWMCDVGESQQELLERFEESLVGPSIRARALHGARTGARVPDLFLAPRCSGRPSPPTSTRPRRTSWPLRSGRTQPPRSPARPRAPPAWEDAPGVRPRPGTEKRVIPPALQRFMAERARCDDRRGAGLSRLIRVAARRCQPSSSSRPSRPPGPRRVTHRESRSRRGRVRRVPDVPRFDDVGRYRPWAGELRHGKGGDRGTAVVEACPGFRVG